VVWTIVIVVILVAVGLGYYFALYVPEHDVVTIDGGSWVINGANPSLGLSVGCSDCGQRPVPGAQFTVDVNVQVNPATGCTYFCDSYDVNSFSVNAPYTMVQVAPSTFPINEPAGSYNTWALTVQAPTMAGHYPLGGVVGVTYK
jgi:hypothetical protein